MARKSKPCAIRRESASDRRIRLKVKPGHCTWCKKKIKQGRKGRLWCSDACVDAFKCANWPQHVRKELEKRDKGVCQKCGTDTAAMKALLKSLRQLGWDYGLCHLASWLGKPIVSKAKIWKPWSYRACQCVFCIAIREAEHLARWEADHSLPVIEGGGQCDLDGYRTLCVPCHKQETAKLAARRAQQRKQSKGTVDRSVGTS